MTEWIPRFSVTRPVTVVTAFLVILVVGVVALARIPVQMMPSGWDLPMLWVWVPWRDSTPLETEAQIVRVLEGQLSTVPGIKHIEANANSDYANLELEFHSSTDMDEAYNAVLDRIERATPDLPADVRQTYLWRFDPNAEPIIWAGISIPEGEKDAWYKFSRYAQRRLARLPGVGRVDMWGLEEPMVWVEFRRDDVAAHQIDLSAVIGQLAGDNFQLASGRIEDQSAVKLVRSLSKIEDIESLKRYPIKEGIRLSDIADVTYAAAARADINRIEGREGAAFGVNKESSANTVELSRQLREELLALQNDPNLKGFTFPIFFDQGAMIEDALWALADSALEGGVLAVIILILFLREWRITALIVATIPASLLLTVIILYFQGRTLNLLSLLGLMLAVGMVVDNAVVVVETIYRRRQGGEDPVSAAIYGTKEVILPITLSTLTSIVVFLPIILMSDDTTSALFLSEIGMPVVYIQVGSLLITLLFTPLSTVWLGSRTIPEDPKWVVWLGKKVDAGVARAIARPVDTLVWVTGMLMLTLAVPFQAVSCSGEDGGGVSDFSIRFTVPRSFTYSERIHVVEELEKAIEEHREDWGIRVYYSRLRSSSFRGSMTVYLGDEGTTPKEQVIEDAKKILPDLPGVTMTVGWSEQRERKGGKVRIELFGNETEVLARLAEEVERRMRGVPGVLGVQSDVEVGGSDEVQLEVDREAASRVGLNATAIGRTVSFAMRGAPLPSWYRSDREVQVYSRFRLEDRSSVARVLDFGVTSPITGLPVPLSAMVSSEVGKGWGSIHRRDGVTSLGVTADVDPEVPPEESYAMVEASLEGMLFPPGYGRERGSEWQELIADQRAQQLALLLSVVFVFLIMGVLFESFALPLTVITTVPMAVIGVWWGLYLTDTSFDGMAAVGLIILIGIVVNNGIVLVDVITELRASGMERNDALRRAVGIRLRPILMTALSATVGVIPMAVGDSTFVGIPYAPLGRVVASGMVVATVLTLFFIPYLYAIIDDLRNAQARWLAYVLKK